MEEVEHVVPDGTSSQATGDSHGALKVLGVDASRKAVVGVVGQSQSFLLSLELGNGDDRSEDLFAHNAHVRTDVGEDGGLDEVSFRALDGVTTEGESGAFLLANVDVVEDSVVLDLGSLGTLLSAGGEVTADFERLQAGCELLHEGVVDLFLDVDTSAGVASLSLVHIKTEDGPLDGLLEVGVSEDDVLFEVKC